MDQNWKPLWFRKNKFQYKLPYIKNIKCKALKQDEEEAEEEKIQLWEENGYNVQKRLARFREKYYTWHFRYKIIEPKFNNYSAQTMLSILNAYLNGIPQSEVRCQKNIDKLCHELQKEGKLNMWKNKMEEYQENLNFMDNCDQLRFSLSSPPEILAHSPLTLIPLIPTFTTLPIHNFEPFIPKPRLSKPIEEIIPEFFESTINTETLSSLFCPNQLSDPFFYAKKYWHMIPSIKVDLSKFESPQQKEDRLYNLVINLERKMNAYNRVKSKFKRGKQFTEGETNTLAKMILDEQNEPLNYN
jgi:hypothetical protein